MTDTKSIEDACEKLILYKDGFDTIPEHIKKISFALILSIGINFIQLYYDKPSEFRSISNKLELDTMYGLTKPYITNDSVAQWTADIVGQTLTFDFSGYTNKFNKIKYNYTDTAFSNLIQSLESKEIIPDVIKRRLSVLVSLVSDPVILNKADINGVETWLVENKFVLSYESSNGVFPAQTLIASVMVERTDTRENNKGIIIKSIILTTHAPKKG